MNEPRDVERKLEQWGSDRQPSVDGAFANRLDADLRELSPGSGAVARQRPIWQPAALAFLASLIVFAGVFAFSRDKGDEIELVMGASTQTEVVLPDGEIIAAEAGLALPDGTRIIVGADGSAVIADVVLEAGDRAVVNEGQLEILIEQAPTPTTSVPEPTTTAVPPATETTSPPPSTRPATASTDRTTSTTTPRSTTTAATTPQTTTPPTSTDRTTTTTSDPAVTLEWTDSDGRVRLSWTYVGPETVAGWQVTVTNGDRTRTLAVLRDPAARTITVERIGDAAVTYRVSARDSGGTVIAESNPVAVP